MLEHLFLGGEVTKAVPKSQGQSKRVVQEQRKKWVK